jgi:Fic family protein
VLNLDLGFWALHERAAVALGELAGLGRRLADPHLVSGLLGSRDAVLSSRIEGTQASIEQVLHFDADPGIAQEARDVREVANHQAALNYGLARLQSLPLSLRLLRDVHKRLMQDQVRGSAKGPGEWRRSQVHLGSSARIAEAGYVPPPVPQMREALAALEDFINAPGGIPELLRIALAHYQFEAIHPFTDGNGRSGRLLITLMIHSAGLLPHPLLYLSAYFERRRSEYYARLLATSQRGEWLEWLSFFLEGVATECMDASRRCKALMSLHEQYMEIALEARSPAAARMVDLLFRRPFLTSAIVKQELGSSDSTTRLLLERFVRHGALVETTGQRRNRVFAARQIIDMLEADTQ